MINKIINHLKTFEMISDYRIILTKKRSKEIFYILDQVETIRSSKLDASCNVTIYVDQDNKRGHASFVIYDSYDDEKIKNKIKEAIYFSKFSQNTYFPLPKGETKHFKNESNIKDHFDNDLVFKIANAAFKANTFENGWISSMEVFVFENLVTIYNSQGANYSYTTNSIGIEVIPTFKTDKEEIELYHYFDYSYLDLEQITKDVYDFLSQAQLRSQATKYQGPNTLPVLLEDKEIKQIIGGLIDNLDYSMVYNKIDLVKVNDKFYGEGLDMPDISLVPYVKNSVKNRDVDEDGIILKPTKIVKDNIVLTNHGSNQYGYYLGIKEPTGNLPNLQISQGNYSLENLCSKPHLACLAFSSFQFDIFSGNFGGEVRLAKYFDGSKYWPVSGLTISGNIHELKAQLKFSQECSNIKGYSGPKACLVSKMNIN